MARVLLHLLLMLGLVLNAVVPAASAHAHADASHAHSKAVDVNVMDADAPATRDHAHHHVHDTAQATQADPAAADTGHDCCDGNICQCGCVLPPAVVHQASVLPTPQAA